MQRFRGGLVFKAHTLCVSLNSRLESNNEEEDNFTASGSSPSTRLANRSSCSLFSGNDLVKPGFFISKVDGFVSQIQHDNLRIVGQRERDRPPVVHHA